LTVLVTVNKAWTGKFTLSIGKSTVLYPSEEGFSQQPLIMKIQRMDDSCNLKKVPEEIKPQMKLYS
jgi:hypothetical protein